MPLKHLFSPCVDSWGFFIRKTTGNTLGQSCTQLWGGNPPGDCYVSESKSEVLSGPCSWAVFLKVAVGDQSHKTVSPSGQGLSVLTGQNKRSGFPQMNLSSRDTSLPVMCTNSICPFSQLRKMPEAPPCPFFYPGASQYLSTPIKLSGSLPSLKWEKGSHQAF